MAKDTTLTSADLIRQSDELRSQAQEMMRRERPEVIARIREAISHYELSADELGLGRTGSAGKAPRKSAPAEAGKEVSKSAGKKPRKATRRTAAVSYRDEQGNSWSGFGPKPKWLKEALASGVSEESLRA